MNNAPQHPGDALSALLDGELAPSDAAAVQDHVATCPDCTHELEAVRSARAAVRELPQATPPFGTYERLLGTRRRRWTMTAAAASAAASLALVGISARPARVAPRLAPMVQEHAATASLGDDPLTQLAPAGVPVSFRP